MTTTSIKRGLLISSPRKGFTPTGPSLVRMREFLARQGFVIGDADCIVGAAATRDAILAGFAALIEATRPGDAVVVYYAGHGSLFPEAVGAVKQSHPTLEPMDIADSDATHFNGLLGGELRLLIRALARLCDNVTAILDCCHASSMFAHAAADEAEDREALARIARRAGERIAARRGESARERPVMRSGGEPERTGAVRLLASSASERAYARDDQSILLFTDILVTVLEERANDRGLTWEHVIREVRHRVQQIRPEQRPGVEGNRDRRPFTTETVPTPVDYFHVQRRGQQLHLAAGTAVGITRQDSFELLPYTCPEAAPLGIATIQMLKPFHAILAPARSNAASPPPVMFARRRRAGATELAACLTTAAVAADQAAALDLQSRLAAQGLLVRSLEPGGTPAGYVDLLDLQNPSGVPNFRPQLVARLPLADLGTADALARALRRLERWAGLAAQIGDPGVGPLTGCFGLTCGRLDGDDLAPLRPGALLRSGEPLSLRLHNPGHASVIHIQALRVRADRCIDSWRDVDGGQGVTTNNRITLTERFHRLPDLPGPQHEWLVLAIADGAFDLGLVTPVRDSEVPRGPGEATRVQLVGLSYTLAEPP